MNRNIELNQDTLRQLARYEITLKDICEREAAAFESLMYGELSLDWMNEDEVKENPVQLVIPEMYQYTIADMQQAVKNILAANPTAGDFGKYWRCPMSILGVALGLGTACARDGYGEDMRPESYPFDVYGLPLLDSDMFREAWDCLENLWLTNRPSDNVNSDPQLTALEGFIDTFMENKGKPVTEMVFDDYYKETFLAGMEDKNRRKAASENEKILLNRWLSELCAKGNPFAMKLRFTIEEQDNAPECSEECCTGCKGCN